LVVDARSVAAAPAASLPPGVEPRDLDDHGALLNAYREAHVCVLASHGEAFGLVLVEALACGTPAVASGDAAGPEITPFTFAGDDELPRVILEAATATPQECRRLAERFSLDRCLDAHEALYREAMR
ncbi:MAG: glycosyltransferase, partial [Actinomycetota bacterium]|nr:glycosyltransferase [Actinomycetota bacterium]